MEAIIPRCAGLDVHNKEVQANIRCLDMQTGRLTFTEVRSFSTMTDGLEALAAWLEEHGVTHVAMESTGVFWKPVFNVLEGYGDRFTLLLCNAQHIKNVPGRKTDVKDCQWICQLEQHGLLRGSFVPPGALRELRDLTRHRAELNDNRARVVNRLHKVLQDANIKLSAVASDVLGKSGRAMIQALIAGQTDPLLLAGLAQRRLKRKRAQLAQALRGHVTEHHRHMLRMHWAQLQELERLIGEQDKRIDAQVASARLNETCAIRTPLPPACAEPAQRSQDSAPPLPPQAVPPKPKPTPTPYTFPEAIQALEKVCGLATDSSQNILAEIGTDMSRFPSHEHLCSWTGICPGNRQSAGKRGSGKTNKGNRWLRRAMTQSAWAATHTKDSYFRAQYKRLVGRRGKKRAIVAVAHGLLVTIYHILKYHTEYVDLGADYFEHLHEERRLRRHISALVALGYTITPPQLKAAS